MLDRRSAPTTKAHVVALKQNASPHDIQARIVGPGDEALLFGREEGVVFSQDCDFLSKESFCILFCQLFPDVDLTKEIERLRTDYVRRRGPMETVETTRFQARDNV